MYMRWPDEVVMYYVQSVVVRSPVEKYLEMVEVFETLVKRDGKFITGGKLPLYPETGSDYLMLGDRVAGCGALDVFNASKFVERTKTLEESQLLMNKHRLSLHCNHSTWTPRAFLSACKEIRPDWYEVAMKIKEVLGDSNETEKIKQIYSEFEPGNVELLTRTLYDRGEAQVAILPFSWAHITTWNDLLEYFNSSGIPAQRGDVVLTDSRDTLVLGQKGKVIAGIGLEDFVVVDTPDALLICPKNQSGKLEGVLKDLSAKGLGEYL